MLINIRGKKIWYEIYGTEYNDTLLYLHGGLGASCLDFVNQARALSGKMKVVIFDQLGVLRSEAVAENESYSSARSQEGFLWGGASRRPRFLRRKIYERTNLIH